MADTKERGSLVEPDPHKRMFKKFIFLLIIAVLVVVVYIWQWLDEPEKQSPKEMVKEASGQIEQQSEQQVGLNKDKMNAALGEEYSSASESESTETASNTDDLETEYQQQYGDKTISKTKEQAKTGLALYLLQVSDWEKWEGIVTDSFMKEIKPDIQALKEKHGERKMENVELFAATNPEKNNMTYGAFATWHVTVNGQTTSNSMQLYYITLKQKNGKWLVSDIVTPNQQRMEGSERKEKS